ncbi:hypothetical protein Q1695_002706 [Nippostrongylus brasiliensis]|nr:hypothetical protein Q1695_002706 [Nippostrongylus brasiliensis]
MSFQMVKKVQKQTAGHQTLDRQKMEKEIREFLENQFKREAGARYGALLSKADEIYEKLREDIRKASEFVLPKEIHALNLLDFLNGVGCSDEHDEGCKAETPSSENLVEGESKMTAAMKNLSIPIEGSSSIMECDGMQNNYTPLQENRTALNLPTVIRPKITDVKERRFRAARGDELAFSVDGSPIVIPPSSTDPSTQVMKQIVESNEDLLSPNTREVVSLFKSLVRKKVAEAQKREPDLSQECD